MQSSACYNLYVSGFIGYLFFGLLVLHLLAGLLEWRSKNKQSGIMIMSGGVRHKTNYTAVRTWLYVAVVLCIGIAASRFWLSYANERQHRLQHASEMAHLRAECDRILPEMTEAEADKILRDYSTIRLTETNLTPERSREPFKRPSEVMKVYFIGKNPAEGALCVHVYFDSSGRVVGKELVGVLK